MPVIAHRRRGSALSLCAALALLSACEERREADLLDVTSVEPARLEPGHLLVVEGDGFPAGRGARVRLAGTMHRPGAAPREVRLELGGRAVSAERVEARFTEDALAELGGRGSLHGTVAVLFAAADGHGVVRGTSRARVIDVAPSSTRRLTEEFARARAASAWLEELGVTLGERGDGEDGLPIEAIDDGSIAASAGLIVGDRVLALDDVSAYEVADLIPPPGVERASMRVSRRGEAAPFLVRLPLGTQRTGLATATRIAAQLALGWLLFVFLWLAPSAGLADVIARRARRSAPDVVRPRRFAWLPRVALAIGVASVLPALDHAGLLVVPLEAVVLGALALRLSATWLAGSGPRRVITASTLGSEDGGPEAPSRVLVAPALRRALALLLGLGTMALPALGLATLAALGGTTDLSGLHAQQGSAPTEWWIVSSPLGPLLLASIVLGAGAAPGSLARSTSAYARVARGIDDVVLLALAAVTATVLLGGWGPDDATPLVRVARAALFAATVSGLFFWMLRARERTIVGGRSVAIGAGLFVTVLATGIVSLTLDPPEALPPALAHVVGAASVLLGITIVVRLFTKRVRDEATLAHPFL